MICIVSEDVNVDSRSAEMRAVLLFPGLRLLAKELKCDSRMTCRRSPFGTSMYLGQLRLVKIGTLAVGSRAVDTSRAMLITLLVALLAALAALARLAVGPAQRFILYEAMRWTFGHGVCFNLIGSIAERRIKALEALRGG